MISWSAHIALLFREEPLLQRFAAAATAGFAAVEMWSPFEHGERQVAAAVDRCGLRLVSFNLPAGDMAAGERGRLNLPEQREQLLRYMRRARELARRLGARHVNALVGNLPPGWTRKASLQAAAETLREFALVLEEDDAIDILIEPLNAAENPAYLLRDADEAAAFIEMVDRPQVGMLYDAYHAAQSGRDWGKDLCKHAGLVRHVHYADSPGRHEPGTGATDVRSLIRVLDAVGYQGAIGLEYRPFRSSRESLDWLPRGLRREDARELLGILR